MSGVELADILREVAEKGKINASAEHWKALDAIVKCRTAALGGHLYQCRECSAVQPQYNSCRNRHCPKCQGGATAKWLLARAAELLPVPYFHLVFTVPHELNELALKNKRLFFDLLFKAVSKTVQKAAKRRYGGKVGFFAILHSWGQRLEFHPHIHCVVPGVVIESGKKAKRTRNNYFLPKRVLSILFRATLLRLLKQHQHQWQRCEAAPILKAASKKNWIVYAKKPFASPERVLKYLSRYTHRIAISNRRIRNFANGKVTFSYRDYKRSAARRLCTLSAYEFARRFLMHVLPHQFVRIRHYGFLANSNKAAALKLMRDALGQKTLLLNAIKSASRCKDCGMPALELLVEIKPIIFTGSQLHQSKILPLVA